MSQQTSVILTPSNFTQAKAAILYALSQDMTPTFTWAGNESQMTKGKTYYFTGLDKNGDLAFKNDDNNRCHASPSNCTNGCFILNISPDKLAEYSQQHLASAIADLQQLKATFDAEHVFAPGDVIQWKPGMRDRNYPAYGTPAIVLEVLSPPIQQCDDISTCSAPAKHDLVIGINMKGELIHYYADSRRYQPVQH
ncbi:hypothetical protein NRZ31_04905 [Aeromonas dhakensis]|uniref:hypothetical protein n=1 Tax=Aeromonas dhakensis TaxID=196024 RepID=UPI00227C3EBB|nr:hypothetical protein [Aeromonas dhakensis]WAG00113.1 hypothetical protein NRZ31_04905 [Aeromonas dhakensis]